ncbi:CRISPR-associated endoribonuclease [Tepiditoga spiralis]|uniref:CRISPR-associated endoribonuclease n=1 Tax=Tepiditoga spiralis TaxID=2108365 RepID=A0A7G1G4I0_9BACT|nr:CRISPR-associated endoribonuclease Cas6 [Tepiditoga spiralis]BBE31410.1 CRISPR-associated endoribonuclease [Tepiditoga spiralis]
MIIKITFKPKDNATVDLPVHYNRPLQGMFYSLMDFMEEKTPRLFTFSRIYPEDNFKVENKRLKFNGNFVVYFTSPIEKINNSIINILSKKNIFRVEKNYFELVNFKIIEKNISNNLLIKTLSPITTYISVNLPSGNRYTHYFTPYSTDFKVLIEENLKRKAELVGIDTKNMEFNIEPYGITEKNEKILFYKGVIVKGWTGYYKISGSKTLVDFALNSGIGAKNSQGFGMIVPIDEFEDVTIEDEDEFIIIK